MVQAAFAGVPPVEALDVLQPTAAPLKFSERSVGVIGILEEEVRVTGPP